MRLAALESLSNNLHSISRRVCIPIDSRTAAEEARRLIVADKEDAAVFELEFFWWTATIPHILREPGAAGSNRHPRIPEKCSPVSKISLCVCP
jgi:hypothetical protein